MEDDLISSVVSKHSYFRIWKKMSTGKWLEWKNNDTRRPDNDLDPAPARKDEVMHGRRSIARGGDRSEFLDSLP